MPIKRLNIPIRLNDLFKVIRFFNSREEELHVSYRDLRDQLQTDLNVTAGSSTLDGLSDVTISSVANGQVLVYDSATSQWINQTAGPATTLDGLSDVAISSVADGEFLVYNSTSTEWENTAVTIPTTLNSLSDVTTLSPSDGDVLTWDSSGAEWVALAPVYSSTFAGLSDVNVAGVADENTIKYDASTQTWVPTNITPATSLNGLTDVALGTLSDGQLLVYDSASGQWENQSSPITVDNGLTLDPTNSNNIQLGGTIIKTTVITVPNTTDVVRFDAPGALNSNGAYWFNAIAGAVHSPTDVLVKFKGDDCIAAQFISDSIHGGGGTAVDIFSQATSVTALNIRSSNNGNLLKIGDEGQLILGKYTTGTSFVTGSGTSVGVLNVDSAGKVFVGPGGGGPGGGDMLKSTYDVDNDGVVDSAERVEIIVRNSTGNTLTKGQIVYLSGATGNRPNALLADATTEATSSKTIGMVVADIANNSDGYVAVNGTLHDLNTNSFADGDTLWLGTTAGGVVANTPPAEPNHAVFIGYVARAHPTLGRIVLKIQNGYELNELHGVLINSEANNDLLVYETSSTLWKNKSLSTAYPNIVKGSFGVTVDGVTAVVQAGQVGYVVMPYDGTITRWTITSNVSGSISFDIWKNASIDTIPTISDSQVGGAYPSIAGTNFGSSTNLTSWISTTFSAGHIFGFYVNSASTIKNATLTLRVTKS